MKPAPLLAAVAGVVTVVGLVVGLLVGQPVLGLLAGLVVGVAIALWVRRSAVAIVLRRVGAEPASAAEFARYHNLVESLSASSGVPKPALYVRRDDQPNALTVGLSARQSALVATTGLLERLGRIELEGVVAHELSHIRRGDVAVATLAAVLVPVPSWRWRLAGARRENLADLAGVSLTRYPPGLLGALEIVHAASPAAAPASTAHLWLAPSPDTLEERIATLREL